MLPRSYDERVKADVHKAGFRLSSNSIGDFGESDPRKQTKDGYDRMRRGLDTFTKHVDAHKQAEDHERANRRFILAAQKEARWAYSKN